MYFIKENFPKTYGKTQVSFLNEAPDNYSLGFRLRICIASSVKGCKKFPASS
jgi:hypothetical protein